MGSRGPGWPWQQWCCFPFSLVPPRFVSLRYKGSAAWKPSLGVTYPYLDICFLLCWDEKVMLPQSEGSVLSHLNHPLPSS